MIAPSPPLVPCPGGQGRSPNKNKTANKVACTLKEAVRKDSACADTLTVVCTQEEAGLHKVDSKGSPTQPTCSMQPTPSTPFSARGKEPFKRPSPLSHLSPSPAAGLLRAASPMTPMSPGVQSCMFPGSPTTSCPGSPTSSRQLSPFASESAESPPNTSRRIRSVLPSLSSASSPTRRPRSATCSVTSGGLLPPLAAGTTGRPHRSSMMANTGSRCTLDDFSIVRTLGVGFMGSVRLVKLRSGVDPTPFALKVMKKKKVIKQKQVTHVMQEVELLRMVRHTFIVRFLTAFQDDAHLFMCMEYLGGGELFTFIQRQDKLSPNVACFYAGEVVLALGHLHSFDIVYRDLKPENILMDSSGHVKIADLGFAKVVTTRTWTMCGTPEYMAPEIVSRKGHGKPVDWWALGVLTYEMVFGKAPFRSPGRQDIYDKVLNAEPFFPQSFKNKVQSFIVGLLHKDSTRRLGSGASGAEEVKGHAWFGSVDFSVLEKRKYRPPITPKLAGPDDTSLFDKYPEEDIGAGDDLQISDEEQGLFYGY